MNAEVNNLQIKFQQQADVDALITYGKSLGHKEQDLYAVTDLLQPVFEALSLGLQPPYEELNHEQLLQHELELEFVVSNMMQSPAADMKIAAFHIVGKLDWKTFIPQLKVALASENAWERIEAATALGRMSHQEVRDILLAAHGHTDLHTRKAVSDALQHFDSSQ